MNKIINVLFEISITSSILISVIFLLRKLFGFKISAVIQYSLWFLVVLRLLMPFSIPSSVSVMNIFHINKSQLVLMKTKYPIFLENQGEKTELISDNILKEDISDNSSAVQSVRWLDGTEIAIFVWILGIFCTTGYMILINIAYMKKIKNHSIEFPNDKMHLLKKTAAELKINKEMLVVINDTISSPCLIGSLNPKIVITSQVLENEDLIRYVFLHELCHYKQKDNWMALLRNLCCAIYWFNPFVWIAAVISRHDGELACDERVLKYLDSSEKINYGEALLQLIRADKFNLGVMNVSTTMTSGGKKMGKRIHQIVKQPKTLKTALAAVIIILLMTGGITFSGTVPTKADNTENKNNIKRYADLEKIASYQTPYVGDVSKVGGMIGSLPQPSVFHIQNMFSLQTDEEPYGLTAYYEANEYEGENVPFFYSSMENNALILFTYINNVGHITFAFRDTPSIGDLKKEEYAGIYEFSRSDLEQRFGDLWELREDLELFNSVLRENSKIDYERVHLNRIRFEADYDEIVNRYGSEPDEIIENPDNSYGMLYKNIGAEKQYINGEYIETKSGSDVTFYLDGGGIKGVYAAYTSGGSEILWNLGIGDDLTYEGIVNKLGQPQIAEEDKSSISYLLYGYTKRYVTFLFDENGNLTNHGFENEQ